MRKSLALRLKIACSHLSADEFDALVTRMTHEQLRGEGVRWDKEDL